jgi:acyl-CoA reductase-like NAD-dependent aldehyde dehydrogenase
VGVSPVEGAFGDPAQPSAIGPGSHTIYHAPFGGRKGSSHGAREQGSYAREFYTAVKTCYTAGG